LDFRVVSYYKTQSSFKLLRLGEGDVNLSPCTPWRTRGCGVNSFISSLYWHCLEWVASLKLPPLLRRGKSPCTLWIEA